MLLLKMFLFSLLIAFIVAKLEINIEGKHGFARDLPTWRLKNKFTKLIWGEYTLTGYHLWLEDLIIVMLHLPFFLGFPWSIARELQLVALFLIAVVVEDFFWFWLNPSFGIKKFNKTYATWHESWALGVPTFYIKLVAIGIGLLLVSAPLS